ncbi:MAG: hypothetical protein ACE5HV_01300 [Acidobacteriota bacterium]
MAKRSCAGVYRPRRPRPLRRVRPRLLRRYLRVGDLDRFPLREVTHPDLRRVRGIASSPPLACRKTHAQHSQGAGQAHEEAGGPEEDGSGVTRTRYRRSSSLVLAMDEGNYTGPSLSRVRPSR